MADPASTSSELGLPFLSLVGTRGIIAIVCVLGRLKWMSVYSVSYGSGWIVAGPSMAILPWRMSTPSRAEQLLFCCTATSSSSSSSEGLSLTLKLADPTMGTSDPLAAVTEKAGFLGWT